MGAVTTAKTAEKTADLLSRARSQLRDWIISKLEAEDDPYLGSEDELLKHVDVGRMTLRQAARQLEAEGVLTVRRGPGGGYFAAMPTIDSVQHVAEIYLRLRGLGVADLLDTASAISSKVCVRAALSDDEEGRVAAQRFLDDLAASTDLTPADQIELETQFLDCLYRLANKPLLELVGRITQQYLRHTKFAQSSSPEQLELWRTSRLKVMGAILDRDGSVALLHAERWNEMATEWITSSALEPPRPRR